MEKEKDSEKDKKKEANLSLHIVELSDTADAEVGVPVYVKITFGGKAYATAKKADGKFDETFKIKVGEEGSKEAGTDALLVSAYTDNGQGLMKLIGQKSVTIPQLLGDMERKKDDKEKKETWALTKNGQTSAQLTLSMSKTKSKSAKISSKLKSVGTAEKSRHRSSSHSKGKESEKKDREKDKDEKKEDDPMDEKTEGDKTEKELKKVKSSKSAKPPKDSVKSADGSKKVSSSQKFADSMKKARLAYWPRLCQDEESLSWADFQAKQVDKASSSALSPRLTNKTTIQDLVAILAKQQPTLKQIYHVKKDLKEDESFKYFLQEGGFVLLVSHLFNANPTLLASRQEAILDVLAAYLSHKELFDALIVDQPDVVNNIALSASYGSKAHVYDFLTQLPVLAQACGLSSDDVCSKVFKAMTYYALKTGEQRRFSALVNTVALEADSASQAAALRLINLLVKSKKEIEERMSLRAELIGLGLVNFLNALEKSAVPDPLVPPVKEFRESMRKDMDEFTAYSAELLQQPVDWKENRTLSLLCAALIKRVNKNENVQRMFFEILNRLLRFQVDPDVGMYKWSLLLKTLTHLGGNSNTITFDNRTQFEIDALIADLKQSEKLQSDVTTLGDEKAKLIDEKAKLADEKVKLAAKVAELQAQLATAAASTPSPTVAPKSEVEASLRFQNELAFRDAKITELNGRLGDSEKKHLADVKELAERLQLRNAEVDSRNKELQSLKAELSSTKSSLEESRKQAAVAKPAVDPMREDEKLKLLQENQRLKIDLDEQRSQLERERISFKSQAEQVAKLETDLVMNAAALEASSKQNDDVVKLAQDKARLETTLKDSVNNAQATSDGLKSDLERAKQELQSSQADKAKLSKDVTDLSKAKANAEAATSEAKATVAELQSQLTVLLNDKQNLQQRIDDLKAVQVTASSSQGETANIAAEQLQLDQNSLAQERAALAVRLMASQQSLQEQKEEIVRSLAANEASRGQLQKDQALLDEKLLKFQADLAVLEADRDKLQKDRDVLEKNKQDFVALKANEQKGESEQIAFLNGELAKKNEELAGLQTEASTQQTKAAELAASLKERSDVAAELDTKLSERSQQLAALEADFKRLEDDRVKLQVESEAKERAAEAAVAELKHQQVASDAAAAEKVAEKETSIEGLTNQLASLQARHDAEVARLTEQRQQADLSLDEAAKKLAAEIDSNTARKTELDNVLSNLQAAISVAEQSKAALEKDNEGIAQRRQALEAELEQVEATLAAKTSSTDAALAALKENLDAETAENERRLATSKSELELARSNFETQRTEIEAKLAELTATLETKIQDAEAGAAKQQQERLAQLETSAEEREVALKHRAALAEQEEKTLIEEAAKRQADLDKKKALLDTLASELKQEEDRINEETKRVSEESLKLSEQEDEIEEDQKKVDADKKRIAKEKEELAEERAKLAAEKAELEKERAQLHSEKGQVHEEKEKQVADSKAHETPDAHEDANKSASSSSAAASSLLKPTKAEVTVDSDTGTRQMDFRKMLKKTATPNKDW